MSQRFLPAAGDKALIVVMMPDGEQIVCEAEIDRFAVLQHGELRKSTGRIELIEPMRFAIQGRTAGFSAWEEGGGDEHRAIPR